MPAKKKSTAKKKLTTNGKLKIRGGKDIAEEISEEKFDCLTKNPIKTITRML